MPSTTPEAIRDRAIAVIEALVPARGDARFRAYRNERGANFEEWSKQQAAACRRRFQVRTSGRSRAPTVSNTDHEEHWLTLHILIAYPQTHRDGRGAALDRDDTADADAFQIDKAIGMLGKANFTSPFPDATWHEDSPGITERIEDDGVDFVEIEYVMFYKRARF